MTKQAKGAFDVKATPYPSDASDGGLDAMRMRFDKTFHGDFEGTSVAQMLGLLNRDIGSGAYVALERLTGRLGGRSGSFCLYHSSTMDRGTPAQLILVVPDSGTDGLVGITGSMTIDIIEGKHLYAFDYEINV